MKMLALVLSEIFQKMIFCGEVGDGSGGMNAICIQPKVGDNVISGTDVDTFQCYAFVNFGVLLNC